MKFLTKIISLSVVMMFLSGCELVDTSDDIVIGGEYYNPHQTTSADIVDSEPENINNDDGNQEKNQDDNGWKLRDLLLYSVKNSMYTDVSAPDGSTLQIVAPSVTYSYNDMARFLKDNSYMSKHYTLSETSRDQNSYASFGAYGQHANASVERLICGQKIENITNANDEVLYSDILISVGQDYNTYSSPNYFSVVVNSTTITHEMQDMIYELLAEQIGEQIAEYAIYGKTLDSQANECDLKDSIPTEDGRGKLIITRVVSSGSLNIEIDFQDNNEFDESRYAYYDRGYKPVYNESRLTLADIFTGDFGGNDPSDDIKFFDKFMSGGGRSDEPFIQTVKNHINIISNEGTNKMHRNYKFDVDLTKGCNMDFADAPFFKCDITAYFDSRSNNNHISGTGEFIAGYTGVELCSEEEAFNELIEAARDKIRCLFPSVDISDMRYENFYKNKYTAGGSYTATSADVSINADIVVQLGTKYYQEYDEDGNSVDTDIPQYYYAKVTFTLS